MRTLLQNYRFTWFSTAQALLFAALGFAWDKGVTLVYLICVVGVAVAVSAMAALRLSDRAYSALGTWWKENLGDYEGPPRHGFEAGNYRFLSLMPSKVLPW